MAKYIVPEGCEGVSLLDKYYPAENGVVDVPDIVHDLESKGFKPYVAPKAVKKTAKDE